MSVTPSKITLATALASNYGENYKTQLQAHEHTAIADEPVSLGGKDEGPSPADYLCMALASCKAITLRMYVQRKNWEVENINVNVQLQKEDLSGSSSNKFICEVSFSGNVSEEQKQRLLHIAKACPVSKLLTKVNEVDTTII